VGVINILGTRKRVPNARFVILNMMAKLKKKVRTCLRRQAKKGQQRPQKNLSKYGGIVNPHTCFVTRVDLIVSF